MVIAIDAAGARRGRQAVEVKGFTRKANEDDSYYVTQYMGAPPDTAPAEMRRAHTDKTLPQAYLVEQPAQAVVPPHFHDTDQFQVFVAGSALFGKQAVRPLSLHYAGGHTPYGPIVTEAEPAHYFTLRANWDSGGKPMPASRDLLKPVPRRHRLAGGIPLAAAAARATGRVDVVATEADGLGAALFELAEGDTATLEMAAPGGGQYALVVAGEAVHDGAGLTRHSCLFRFPDEPPLSLAGGAGGAAILLMQFPVPGEIDHTGATNA